MKPKPDRREGSMQLVTAQEIACWVYCPEQYRLQYGLKLPAVNRRALAAGTRHHEKKAAVERVAGESISLGRALVVVAVAALLFTLWLIWR